MNKFLPKEPIKGHRGYYPVCNKAEWDALPAVYKAMEWYPVDVYNPYLHRNEKTIPEYIEFEVIFLDAYKTRGIFRVHVQEVQKILFCSVDSDIHLHSICGVVFANGERWGAEWKQDSKTGAFAVYASGKLIGMQGGYLGHIPSNIEETEDGFKWKGIVNTNTRCHYTSLSPWY